MVKVVIAVYDRLGDRYLSQSGYGGQHEHGETVALVDWKDFVVAYRMLTSDKERIDLIDSLTRGELEKKVEGD